MLNDLRNILCSDDLEDDVEDNERLGHKDDDLKDDSADSNNVETGELEVPLEINNIYYNNVLNTANEGSNNVGNTETYFIDRDTSNPSHTVDPVHTAEPDPAVDPDPTADPLHIAGPVVTDDPPNEYYKYIIESRKKIKQKSTAHVCTKCGIPCSSAIDLKYHMQKEHNEVRSKFEICDEGCSAKSNLNAHMKIMHNNSAIRRKSSETMDGKFVSENLVDVDLNNPLEMEEKTNIEPQTQSSQYKCDKCNFFGKNFKSLKAHKRLTHTAIRYKCKLCHYSAVYKNFIKNHMIREHKEQMHSIVTDPSQRSQIVKQYTCDQCDKRYGTVSHLNEHKNSVHNGIKYPCSLCDKAYTKRSGLKVHMKSVHSSKNIENPE